MSSALPLSSDIARRSFHFAFVPTADLARASERAARHDAGGQPAGPGLQDSGQRSACPVVFENQIGERPGLVFR